MFSASVYTFTFYLFHFHSLSHFKRMRHGTSATFRRLCSDFSISLFGCFSPFLSCIAIKSQVLPALRSIITKTKTVYQEVCGCQPALLLRQALPGKWFNSVAEHRRLRSGSRRWAELWRSAVASETKLKSSGGHVQWRGSIRDSSDHILSASLKQTLRVRRRGRWNLVFQRTTASEESAIWEGFATLVLHMVQVCLRLRAQSRHA